MKLFLDTANIDEIKQALDWGVLDGVTTNPTHVAKVGRPLHQVVAEICDLVNGPISAEVTSGNVEGILTEARELAAIHPNVVVKVPLMKEGLKAVRLLAEEGIRCNVTLCFQPLQALLAAKAGAYFISPFVDRLNRIGEEGGQVLRHIRKIYDNYHVPTQILAASVRSPLTVLEAALAGADVCTMPFEVLGQLYSHPLTDQGIDTFLKDAAKIPKTGGSGSHPAARPAAAGAAAAPAPAAAAPPPAAAAGPAIPEALRQFQVNPEQHPGITPAPGPRSGPQVILPRRPRTDPPPQQGPGG